MSKLQKRFFISLTCIIVILGSLLLFWYFGDTYHQFYPIANAEFKIEGLKDGFVPQGLTYDETSNTFLTCGYMNNGDASRVYVINGQTLETEKYFTLTFEGKDYVGHAGGIATDGTSVWLCGDGQVLRFRFSDAEAIECGESLNVLDCFESQNGADFLTIENGNLWVGEFHKDGKYDRPESHQFETNEGKINKALSFCYEINSSKEYGIESTTPIKALSTGSLVQGMVITDSQIVLSTSYSLPNSHIYAFENILSQPATETFEINGSNIDVYVLADSNLETKIEAPSMSEEITECDGKIYILFESACKKYKAFTREQINSVYSIGLEDLKNI